jgi:hypothetical protein
VSTAPEKQPLQYIPTDEGANSDDKTGDFSAGEDMPKANEQFSPEKLLPSKDDEKIGP